MFLTKTRIPRRKFLRAAGVALPLPFLDAMIPAASGFATTPAAGATRLCCIEMVHGSAGSTAKGAAKHLWSPAAGGRHFDLSTGSLSPLEPLRQWITIVSNTDVRNADALDPSETGGDHPRSSSVFLTQSRPRRTVGADVRAGISLDQIVAERFAHQTAIPSLQLCIEKPGTEPGGVQGYSPVYADTISWSSPTRPMPMVRDPRLVFDQLFGAVDGSREKLSILDWLVSEISRTRRNLGPRDRARLEQHLDDIREVERRIQKQEALRDGIEAGEMSATSAPEDYEEHVKLMFDLQVKAFVTDLTRVIAFKMSRDASGRVFTGSGVSQAFHAVSHHGEREDKIALFAKINTYHVGLVTYFLEKLRSVEEGDSSLLDKSLVLYGSPMGNSNFHNHKRCPIFVAGHANGALKGNLHVEAAEGTPMANVMLTLLHALGLDDMEAFGDSTAALSLNS